MELVNHIRDLLYHHDCVIVPGFGGFVTNERSARIDSASNSFYPPSRGVGFNARLDHNDGLLISYLSAKLSMNYVDTRKLVEEFSDEVNRKLESGRTVLFEGIGQFSAGRDRNLLFDPDPLANFLSDAYGLTFFRYPVLEKTEPGRRIRKKAAEARAGVRLGARKLLRYAAIGIPLIAALTWGAMNTDVIREFSFDLSSLNPFAAVVDSGIRTSPAADEDAPVAVYGDEAVSMRQALMYEEENAGKHEEHDVPSTLEEAGVPARMHYLVAGSFRSRQNALVLRESLLSRGYRSEIVEPENGFYRVSLFASADPGEALQMLRQVRAMDNRDVWMLSR